MIQEIRTAVFPVAGMGTRFLPATKASPKEMLPVVDEPLIQYAVEEAVAAGMGTLVFITGRNKRAIEDHFDKAYELETELENAGKDTLLALVRRTATEGDCVFIRQREARGLGDAVARARPVVGDEPFAVLLADDLIDCQGPGVIGQMMAQYQKHQCSILGVERVPKEETGHYGIVSVSPIEARISKVEAIVEKPAPADAPSNLAVVGRYILTPEIFGLLERTSPGAGGEIQLTDAIAQLLETQQVLAFEYEGKRYDCGSKLGYLSATVEYGLRHKELGDEFRRYLLELSAGLRTN